jgi:hypothetical protein
VSSINGPRGGSATNTTTKVADLSVGKAPPPEVRPKDPAAEVLDSVEVEESVPQVDEGLVRSTVMALGGALSFVVGDEDVPGHWRFTDQELVDLVPPLTRIINRNVKLRRAVIRGDEMAIAVALGGYLGRNVRDGNKARKVRRERDGEAELAEGDAGADGPGLAQGGGYQRGVRPGDGRFDDDAAGGGLGR